MSQQGNQLGKERQKMYKNADRHEDLRRRRTECSVELRKQKRDDAKMKRRNLVIEEDDVNVDVESSGEGPQNPSLPLEEILKILTNNPAIIELRRCFEALRRHVSRDKCPPVDEVIRLNLVEAMVSALSVGDPKVVFEAAWGITNIVSGTTEQTAHAIHKGCLEPLVKLCYADDVKVAEQAVWALANITGDTPEFRDRVIAAGGLDALGHLTRKVSTLRIDFVRTIAWWYSNMCRHKNPQAPIEVLKALAHGLATMVAHEDSAVRQDATWAFSYMTDGPDCQIILPYQVGALDGMVNALDEQNDAIIAPTVRVLGNFATGADELTQILIDKGYLAKYVPNLLQSGRSSMTKETVWLVSNVFAGTRDQIKYMMGLNVLPHIMHIFATGDSKCKLEASWCISNLVQGGSPKQIMKIVENGFSSITDGLRGTHHVDTVINMLDSIMGILNTAETISRNTYATLLDDFEASGCLDLIEGYQQHQSENIYQKALNIVEKHFCENEDEDVVVNVHPEDPTKPEGGFQF
ncbi:hypothetical protein QR680_009833 [Steinernema hermaphroditum]|uniref:Importin subunit alpha n=1 Tax=Steinernema hermaphroditum TaxID=289476 RepID=A0AA39ILS9_9BILA|nr:hypothetical protein QR680_009833 [Steinernema hermaphroditum]